MSTSPFRALNGNSTPIASPVFMQDPTFDSPTWDAEPHKENEENSAPPMAHSSHSNNENLLGSDDHYPTLCADEQNRSPSLKKLRTGGTPHKQTRRNSTERGTSSNLFLDTVGDYNHHNDKTMNIGNNTLRLSDEHKDVRFSSPRHYSSGSRLTQVQVLEQEHMARDPRLASMVHSNLARRSDPGALPLTLSKMTSPNAAAGSFSTAAANQFNSFSSPADNSKRRSTESTVMFNTAHDCMPFSEPAPVLFPLVDTSKEEREEISQQTRVADGTLRRHSELPSLQPSSSHESTTSSSVNSRGSVHSNWTAGTSSSSTASSMASALVKRMMTSNDNHHGNTSYSSKASSATSSILSAAKPMRPHRHSHRSNAAVRGTPVRIKPRVRNQDVQATDEGYASVAKLSAWLADDPTSNKKIVTVRRGVNVINKSRRFEKDLEDVIVEEVSLKRGGVKEKKQWLSSVFSEDEEDVLASTETQSSLAPSDCGFGGIRAGNHDCAASTISVSNKKQWLQNAFKSSSSEIGTARDGAHPRVAQSDIGPATQNRDLDLAGSRAKLLWQKKSEQRLLSPERSLKPVAKPSPWRETPHQGRQLERPLPRASVPTLIVEKKHTADAPEVQRHSVTGAVPVNEDTTQIDFRAARALLIQRSKQNGNEVKVASKIQRRMDKFEKMGQNNMAAAIKQKVVPTKSIWNSNKTPKNENGAGPSNSYSKTLVPDIAPQRSFEELP